MNFQTTGPDVCGGHTTIISKPFLMVYPSLKFIHNIRASIGENKAAALTKDKYRKLLFKIEITHQQMKSITSVTVIPASDGFIDELVIGIGALIVDRLANVQQLSQGACPAADILATANITASWNFIYDGDGNRVQQEYFEGVFGQDITLKVTSYFAGGSYELDQSGVVQADGSILIAAPTTLKVLFLCEPTSGNDNLHKWYIRGADLFPDRPARFGGGCN